MTKFALIVLCTLVATCAAQSRVNPFSTFFGQSGNQASRYRPQPSVVVSGQDNGRYRGIDDGRYRPSDDGQYRPDNSGQYSGDNGKYNPDGSGKYDGSNGKYNPDGSGAYTGQNDRYQQDGQGQGGQGQGGFGSGAIGAGAGGVRRPSGSGLGSGLGSGAGSRRPSSGAGISAGGGFGAPVAGKQGSSAGLYDNRFYRILRQEGSVLEDGYHYLYETENGITGEEQGKLANRGTDEEAMRANGFFTYTGPDSRVYTVTYTADENGFIPQADHLPTPPPVPEAIQRALEWKRSQGLL